MGAECWGLAYLTVAGSLARTSQVPPLPISPTKDHSKQQGTRQRQIGIRVGVLGSGLWGRAVTTFISMQAGFTCFGTPAQQNDQRSGNIRDRHRVWKRCSAHETRSAAAIDVIRIDVVVDSTGHAIDQHHTLGGERAARPTWGTGESQRRFARAVGLRPRTSCGELLSVARLRPPRPPEEEKCDAARPESRTGLDVAL
jgi:hypothetical protein